MMVITEGANPAEINETRISKMNNIFTNKYFEELIAHHKENKNAQPLAHHATRGYLETKEYGLDTLTVSDMPFAQDMDGFIKAVNEAGIREFNLCDKSTGLMACLHYLLGNGWAVVGTYEKEVDRHTAFYGLCMKKMFSENSLL